MTQLTQPHTAAIKLSVVVPVYKEENSIRPFLARLEPVCERLVGKNYEIIFALDPSPDQTEAVISAEIARNSCIRLLVFSRRFGQPAATMAGIMTCLGEKCVVIDVDLQDPPELIADLYYKQAEGFEVVYAQRRTRQGETFIKRLITHTGYWAINQLSDVKIPRNTGDFRIMTRRVIEELRRLNETHGFLRGMVAFVGFKQAAVLYDRDARFADEGKYNRLTGSFRIGLNGLIGFSSRPLQFMSVGGLLIAFLSFLIGFLFVVLKLLGFPFEPGQAGVVLFVTFFSGVQLMALGLMGEYVGRIYDEVKSRPAYIIDRRVNWSSSHDANQ